VEQIKRKTNIKRKVSQTTSYQQNIVDFYCHAAKLVVELDGKIHLAKKESDRERTKEIEDLGLRIIRFSNEEVEGSIDNIVAEITLVVKDNLNSEE